MCVVHVRDACYACRDRVGGERFFETRQLLVDALGLFVEARGLLVETQGAVR